MAIVIKKKVSFDFLGDEYKDAYIILKSMPIVDYDKNEAERKASKDSNLIYMLKTIKKYFIEGKFPEDNQLRELTVDDLDQFIDPEAALYCFNMLVGNLDPKVEGLSTKPSITEAPAEN